MYPLLNAQLVRHLCPMQKDIKNWINQSRRFYVCICCVSVAHCMTRIKLHLSSAKSHSPHLYWVGQFSIITHKYGCIPFRFNYRKKRTCLTRWQFKFTYLSSASTIMNIFHLPLSCLLTRGQIPNWAISHPWPATKNINTEKHTINGCIKHFIGTTVYQRNLHFVC